MAIEVVGAGLGRTGTHSLKLALERLLDGPCYHMIEVFGRPADLDVWAAAYQGRPPDWAELFADYRAVVDWPAAGCWRQIADAFPDAPVLLSVRDVDEWWTSASATIFEIVAGPPGTDDDGFRRMTDAMLDSFTHDWRDEAAAKAAFLAHNDEVRASVAPGRLIEWQPGDGWGPLCAGLGVPEPSQPFPHVNTTEEFRTRAGLGA
jgi:hypothetical protein